MSRVFLAAHLEAVEALAIHTNDCTLRHKGLRIYLIDDMENHAALTTLSEYEEQLHLMTGVEASAIDDSTSTVSHVDTAAYLFPFLTDNKELN